MTLVSFSLWKDDRVTRQEMKRWTAALLVTLGGCGGTGGELRPAPLPEDLDAESGAASAGERAASGPPAFRARVWVLSPGASAPDNWIDIEVPGDTERERAICERLTQQQMQLPSDAAMEAHLARPCRPALLPSMERPDSGAFLVNRHILSDLDLLFAAPRAAAEGTPAESVSTTYVTTYGTADECEQMRAELVARIEEARAEAKAQAEGWLETQLAEARENEETACADIDRETARCAAMRDETERGLCQTSLEAAQHSCDNARTIARIVEGRLAATREQPPSDDGPMPECHPSP